jgi:hypothetical protein
MHLLMACCASDQQCSAFCHTCSSTTCAYYVFVAILESIPSHLRITVHKILLHFSLLPSVFHSFMEWILPIWYMLNFLPSSLCWTSQNETVPSLLWAGLWNTSTWKQKFQTFIFLNWYAKTNGTPLHKHLVSYTEKWIRHGWGAEQPSDAFMHLYVHIIVEIGSTQFESPL